MGTLLATQVCSKRPSVASCRELLEDLVNVLVQDGLHLYYKDPHTPHPVVRLLLSQRVPAAARDLFLQLTKEYNEAASTGKVRHWPG